VPTSSEFRARSCEHLVRLLLNRNGEVPNFALLLGVISGAAMVQQWRSQAHAASRSDTPLQEWLSLQHWHQSDDEYGTLFEAIYDQAAQRRVYIEEQLKDAHPSWGYVYLTSLLARRVFDVVFTSTT
jgi:hypothetical protein